MKIIKINTYFCENNLLATLWIERFGLLERNGFYVM